MHVQRIRDKRLLVYPVMLGMGGVNEFSTATHGDGHPGKRRDDICSYREDVVLENVCHAGIEIRLGVFSCLKD